VVTDRRQSDDLIPIDVALIQADPKPTASTEVLREIESAGRPLHMFNMLAEPGLEAGGGDSVAAMILQKVGEYATAHPEICVVAAVGALGSGQHKARGAQKAQSPVFPYCGAHIGSLPRLTYHRPIIMLRHRLNA
jgi:hypothetical protein